MSKTRKKAEIEKVIEMAGKMPAVEIARKINRSVSFVANIAADAGVSLGFYKHPERWMSKDLKILKEAIFKGIPARRVHPLLPDRKPSAVRRMYHVVREKMQREGVLPPRRNIVSADKVV